MLAIRRSAGVIPEMNLNKPLHAGEEARKLRIHPGFETQTDITRGPKQGYQWTQKNMLFSKFFLKKPKNLLNKINVLDLGYICDGIHNLIISKMFNHITFESVIKYFIIISNPTI